MNTKSFFIKLTLLTILITQSHAGMPIKEEDALRAFYNSTNGDSWDTKVNWMNSSPCTWYGVTCNEDDSVISLSLWGNGLSGTLPSEIGDLTSLTHLELFANYHLSGSIPAEIGNLTNLTSLSLGSNKLTGNIPAEISLLRNLTTLGLENNELTGSIPSEIGGLSGLTLLSLKNNLLSGVIPSSITAMTRLERLSLTENHSLYTYDTNTRTFIDNITADETSFAIGYQGIYDTSKDSQLMTLIHFYYSMNGPLWHENYNWLVGLNPCDNWFGITCDATGAVTELYLPNNALVGVFPSELFHLNSLKKLNLASNTITGTLPDMGGVSNMTYLDLSSNKFTGSVSAPSNIVDLYLDHNELSGYLPSSGYDSLFTIDLRNNYDLKLRPAYDFWNEVYTDDTSASETYYNNIMYNNGGWEEVLRTNQTNNTNNTNNMSPIIMYLLN